MDTSWKPEAETLHEGAATREAERTLTPAEQALIEEISSRLHEPSDDPEDALLSDGYSCF